MTPNHSRMTMGLMGFVSVYPLGTIHLKSSKFCPFKIFLNKSLLHKVVVNDVEGYLCFFNPKFIKEITILNILKCDNVDCHHSTNLLHS